MSKELVGKKCPNFEGECTNNKKINNKKTMSISGVRLIDTSSVSGVENFIGVFFGATDPTAVKPAVRSQRSVH